MCGVVGVEDLLLLARRGGNLAVSEEICYLADKAYGKKLHAELGRLETRVNISEMSRCCTLVS